MIYYSCNCNLGVINIYTLKINKNKKFDSAKHLYGVFFEDINHAGDGGLNPELINNRSFESAASNIQIGGSLARWSFCGSGEATLCNADSMYETNPHYLHVSAEKSGYTVYNDGYMGVPTKAGESYNFFMWVRSVDYVGDFEISVVDDNGISLTTVVAPDKSDTVNNGWTKYTATIVCNETKNGKFKLLLTGIGNIDLDFISLMPTDTWKGTDASKWPLGGLRKDLVQALYDLKPKFVRFPGGCIVEGNGFANRYQWKNTIGPLEQRKEQYNLWYERSGDDPYWQSYGIGYHEYLQMCEDIGAEPLPIVNCSLSCQFRCTEIYYPDTEEFKREVQDAIDLIEYCNGGVDTVWGEKRAANGHPEPFNLKFLGIGNENWPDLEKGIDFWKNFEAFYKAFNSVHPEITVISTAGAFSSGDAFNEAWERANKDYSETYVDEHFYMHPDWFLTQTGRYDNYDRNGAKVFAGEYAAHHEQDTALDRDGKPNTLFAAVAEAAFLTGVERNADVVAMASYAPLFAKDKQAQWSPNLIWFDNYNVCYTPNYYVQHMFSTNYGNETLDLTGSEYEDNKLYLLSSATRCSETGEIYLKLVNHEDYSKDICIELDGNISSVTQIQLSDTDKMIQNSLISPDNIKPVVVDICPSKLKSYTVPAYSVTVLKIKA